jgi:hypothetical protein
MNRKNFLQKAAIGTGVSNWDALFFSKPNITNKNPHPKQIPFRLKRYKEFVVAGHNDLDKVKSLLLEFPTLLYATWDWRGWRFETALEGAGHVWE